MRIVNSVKASSKEDSKLQLPTDCVQNGILTVCTQLIYLHLFLLSRRKQCRQAEDLALAHETYCFCE